MILFPSISRLTQIFHCVDIALTFSVLLLIGLLLILIGIIYLLLMEGLLLLGDHIFGEDEQLRAKLGPLHQLEPFSALGQVGRQKVRASLVIFDHYLANFPGLDHELAAEKGTAVLEQLGATFLLSRVFLIITSTSFLEVFSDTPSNHIHRQIVFSAVDFLEELL